MKYLRLMLLIFSLMFLCSCSNENIELSDYNLSLKIGEEISKKFPSPQSSTVGLFIAYFIWIEKEVAKSKISESSEMNNIRKEVEKVLGKWDKREWKRYLIRTAFGFKNGNSKPSQEIVNRFLMLIEYIKSLKIELKKVKNYFKEFSYKGVIKQAIEKLDSKKATKKRKTKTKSKTKAKTSKKATTKKQKKEPKKTTKKLANKNSKEVKRTSKKSAKVKKTPKSSKEVKKTKGWRFKESI